MQSLIRKLTLSLFFSLLLLSSALYGEMKFYISPTGNDSNNGSENAPWKTVTKARDHIRTINSGMNDDIVVFLHGGEYDITAPIVFSDADSGKNGHSITYRNYPAEIPVLRGGVKVTGWTPYNGRIYQADLTYSKKLRQLYVDGHRAHMAHTPFDIKPQSGDGTFSIQGNEPWALASGVEYNGIKFNDTDTESTYTNISDIEIHQEKVWSIVIASVDSITHTGSSNIFNLQQPFGAILFNQRWTPLEPLPPTYYPNGEIKNNNFISLVNVFEALDEPGEFYFNRQTGKLYYYLQAWENPSTISVFAPMTDTLLDLSGTDRNNRVENLNFTGLLFSKTSGHLIDVAGSTGYAPIQSLSQTVKYWADTAWGSSTDPSAQGNSIVHTEPNPWESTDIQKGAVNVKYAQNIVFDNNVFKQIGSVGISYETDVDNSDIKCNVFYDIGATAINVGHTHNLMINKQGRPGHITVENNIIRKSSVEFYQAMPISVFDVNNTSCSHNDIEDSPYSGITFGWWWDDSTNFFHGPNDPPNNLFYNKINYNKIKTYMTTLHDGAGIYTLAPQGDPNDPDTWLEVKGNYMINGWTTFATFYLDSGSHYMNWKDNVLETVNAIAFNLNGTSDINIDNNYCGGFSDPADPSLVVKRYGDANNPRISITNMHCELQGSSLYNGNWSQDAQAQLALAGIEDKDKYIFNYIPDPDLVNIALNKTVNASSDFHNSWAVDNNYATFNSTGSNPNEWIEIDLGKVEDVVSVELIVRELNKNYFHDFYVFVTDFQFGSRNDFAQMEIDSQANGGGFAHYPGLPIEKVVKFLLNKRGRYVRLQMEGTESIQMREVHVFAYNTGTPEMHLLGNSIEIVDGDTTPTLDDDTTFGFVLLNHQREKTYTIRNDGTKSIEINGIDISSNEFKLGVEPVRKIAPGNSTTFSIIFNPTSQGTFNSDISIHTTAVADGSFDFTIQGEGTSNSFPEIDIKGNGQLIPNGATNPSIANGTDFGSVDSVNADIIHLFTILNQGSGPLTLSGTPIVAVSGANASDFTVISQPNSTINSSGSSTFEIKFTPSTDGVRVATVTIHNDDSDEGTYQFNIKAKKTYSPVLGINGCVLWLDGNDLDGDNSSEGDSESGKDENGVISVWKDKSTLANDASQGSFQSRPQFLSFSSEINGNSVLLFDGTLNYMTLTSEITDAQTIFWIIKESGDNDPAGNFLLGHHQYYDFSRGGAGFFWGGYTSDFIKNGVTRLDKSVIDGANTAIPNGAYHLISVIATGPLKFDQITRDRSYDTTNWNGGIAEIIVYNRALSNQEIQTVENYLDGKWLNALPNSAPIANDDTYSTAINTVLDIALPGVLDNDSDIDGDALTAIKVSDPAHGTLTFNADGSFSYTPTTDYSGQDSFTYKPNDGNLDGNNATVTINISSTANYSITGKVSGDIQQGVTVAVDATHSATTDASGNYTISGLADGTYTVTPTLPGYTFTPATASATVSGADVTGIDFVSTQNAAPKFTLTVNDGTGSGQYEENDSVTISATVPAGQIFDAWTGDTQYLADASAASTTLTMPAQDITVTATFKQAPPNSHSIFGTITGDIQQGVTVAVDATHSVTTDAGGNFTISGLPDGTYTVTPTLAGYTFAPETANVTISNADITGVDFTATADGEPSNDNNPPIAANDSYFVKAGETLTVPASSGVLTNDIDLDNDAIRAITVQSLAGLTLQTSGEFIYTPTATSGDMIFTYKANDWKSDSNVVSVTITIIPQGDDVPPTAIGDKYNIAQDSKKVVSAEKGVLQNDMNTTNATVTILIDPQNGSLTLNPDGSFEYTPNDNFSGLDSFSYSIDGTTPQSSAIVALNVAPVKVTLGSILTYKSSEVPELGSDTFAKAPKLYGVFPNNKKGSFKKIKASTALEFSGAWGKKFTLYDKKAVKGGYKSYFDLKGPSAPAKITVMVKGKTTAKAKIDTDIQTVQLVPPVITDIQDGSGNSITEASVGGTIVITGKYFGSKAPKVALEVSGKLLKCKVDKAGLTYSDYKGKPSAMDPVTGKSSIRVILPNKLSTGTYPIILDNKVGIATTPEDKGTLPEIIIK
jgi:hypothetical protein